MHHLTIAQCTWLCLLVLANVGCQRRDEEIAGSEHPHTGMTKNPDKSFVPVKGFEDGQVSYQGKVVPAEIFTFYQETIGSKRVAAQFVVRGQKNQIAYTKVNRVALIYYTPLPTGRSF